MTWSTDIKTAPHGRYVVKQRREGVDQRVFVPERVILTTKCGKVTLSHYLPEEKRWLMLGHGEAPVAWMAWPEPFNLPETANELLGGLPVPATEVNVERTGRNHAYTTTGMDGTPHRSGVTGGESAAPNPHLPSGAAACSADTAGTESPPSVSADHSSEVAI